MFRPQYEYAMVSPTSATGTLGSLVNVNEMSGGAVGPVHAGTVTVAVASAGWPPPTSTLTDSVTASSAAGPSITSEPVALVLARYLRRGERDSTVVAGDRHQRSAHVAHRPCQRRLT